MADFLLVGEFVTPIQGVREWRRFPQERSCWRPRLLNKTLVKGLVTKLAGFLLATDLKARYRCEDMARTDDTKLKQIDKVKTEIPVIC